MTNVISQFAVRIILPRTATVILHLVEIGCQAHSHTKLRYQRNICLRWTIVGFNLYISYRVDAITKFVISTYW